MAVATLIPSVFGAEMFRLRKGVVIPVRFEEELSLRENRSGDRFVATVIDDRDLPRGTRMEGTVRDVRPASDGKAGFMDLEFDGLILPDGTRQPMNAVPVRLDDKNIKRGSDGRFYAKKKVEDTGKHVLGGILGGYLLGRLIGDKGTEGAFLGALAGIIIAESDRNSTANEVVVRRDAKMGAYFEREMRFEYTGAGSYGDRRTEPAETRRDDGYVADESVRSEVPVIAYQGRELRFGADEQPYRAGDAWMVPLDRTARQLGFQVDGDAQSRRIYVEDDDTVLIFEQDSRSFRLNGKKVDMPRSLTIKGKVVYVPLNALSAARSGQMTIDGTKSEK